MSQAPEWYGSREDETLVPLLGIYGRGGPNEYQRAMLASMLRQEALLEELLTVLKKRPTPKRGK